MPRQNAYRNIEYLLNLLQRLNDRCFDKDYFLSESYLQRTKPLFNELSNTNNAVDQYDIIINELNTNWTDYASAKNLNGQWLGINEAFQHAFKKRNDETLPPQDFSLLHNAVVYEIKRCRYSNDNEIAWSPEMGVCLKALYKINKEFCTTNPDYSKWNSATGEYNFPNYDSLSNEKKNELLNKLIPIEKFINSYEEIFKSNYDLYWRFNSKGVWSQTAEDTWWVNNTSPLYFNTIDQKTELKKWFATQDPNAIKYGVEIEMPFPKDKINEFFNKLNDYRSENFPEGLCKNNLVFPKHDGTIKVNEGEEKFELNIAAMNFDKICEACDFIGKTAKKCGARFNWYQTGGGIHIHIDRPNDETKIVNLLKVIDADHDKWPQIFGRGEFWEDFKFGGSKHGCYSSGGRMLTSEEIKSNRHDIYPLCNRSYDCESSLDKIGVMYNICVFEEVAGHDKDVTELLQKALTQDSVVKVLKENNIEITPEVIKNFNVVKPGYKIINSYGHSSIVDVKSGHNTIEFRGFNSTPKMTDCVKSVAKWIEKAWGGEYAYGKEIWNKMQEQTKPKNQGVQSVNKTQNIRSAHDIMQESGALDIIEEEMHNHGGR